MNLFLFIYFLIYKQKSFNIGIILIFEKEKKNTIILNFYNNLNLMLHVHRMMVYIFFFKINILGYVSPTKKKKKSWIYSN